MVFESIVADILNKFLGDYVENLDRSQLKIGIWGGDVSLKNLSLKPSALDDLNLPVKTVYGHLGKLVLKIPWKNIYTESVEVFVEGLFLLVNPIHDIEYDEDKEEKLMQEAKQAMISKVEEAKKKEKDKESQQQVDDTFVEKLAAQIIRNVQIFIADIHVRYEDKITKPERPFCVGLSLHTLKIYSTNERCENYVVPEKESPSFFKKMVMEGLSVYWNTDSICFVNADDRSPGRGELLNKLFVDGIASKTRRTVGYDYILDPINSEAILQVNSKPEIDNFKTPKMFLSFKLEQLLLNLRRSQYQDLIALLEQFDRMCRATPFRKYRPNLRQYRGHYKEWWKFAFSCILANVRRRLNDWSWTCISRHRKLCKEYELFYRRKLTEKQTDWLSTNLQLLERDLDAFNIVLIRQKVENEIDREGRIYAAQQKVSKKSGGWFGGWFSSSSRNADEASDQSQTNNIVKQFGNAMNEEEKQKLYRAIDYHENLIPALYPASFVAIRMEFKLEVLKIIIADDYRRADVVDADADADVEVEVDEHVMIVQFKEAHAFVNQRPAAQSYSLSVTMRSFETLGMQQIVQTLDMQRRKIVPEIVRSKLSEDYFLNVYFETNPEDGQYDQRLHVTLRPLKVVYDAQTVIKILQVFTPQNDITTVKNQIQAAANIKFEEMKEKSAVKLQYAIEKSARLDLKVDLMAPYLILPFGGFYTENEAALVINLGRITVASQSRDNATVNVKRMLKQGSSEDQVFSEMMSKCYDCFKICLRDVQVLPLKPGQHWEPVKGSGDSSASACDSHILQPTSVYVDIYKCVVDDDPRLPKIKIEGNLADVTVRITEETLLDMVSLIISLPLPDSTSRNKHGTEGVVDDDDDDDDDEYGDDGNDSDDVSTIYDSTASLRQKLESLNRLQFPTLKKYSRKPLDDETSLIDYQTRISRSPRDGGDDDDGGGGGGTAAHNVDYINVEANFNLKGLTVYVERLGMENPLIVASLATLQLGFVQRTYSCKISAKLGNVSLVQNYLETMVPAISTPVADRRPSDQYLFFCELIIAEKNSPVFEKLYHSTAIKLAVDFTKLYAIVHQDAIMDTMRWIGDLQKNIDNILSSSCTNVGNDGGGDGIAVAGVRVSVDHRPAILESYRSTGGSKSKRRKSSVGSSVSAAAIRKKCKKLKTKSALSAIVEDQLSEMSDRRSRNARKTPTNDDDGATAEVSAVDIVEFHVTASLAELQLCLQKGRSSVASMHVDGLQTSASIFKSRTQIDARLSSICVCDLDEHTLYNRVAYIAEGKQALSVAVTLYNEPSSNADAPQNDFDVSVKVRSSSLHCVFINEFLVNMMQFANNFQTSKKMLAEVSAAAVASAKMNVQQAYQSSTRVQLDISIDAPVILVPRNSRSDRVFIVDFGNLSVANTLQNVTDSQRQRQPLIDHISVILKDMQIIRTNYDRTTCEHTLLKPVNYKVVVKRNLSVQWYNEVADLEIHGEFRPIFVSITADDYKMMVKTLEENFYAKGSAVEYKAPSPKQLNGTSAHPTNREPAALNDANVEQRGSRIIAEVDDAAEYDENDRNIRTMMKFEMIVESVTVDLYTTVGDEDQVGSDSDEKKDGLARFTLSLLGVNGSLLTDGRIALHASLCNCCMDDTRSSKITNPVKRYMQRKPPSEEEDEDEDEEEGEEQQRAASATTSSVRNMVEVIFEKDATLTNVVAHIYSFVLILNVDHLTKIQDFFFVQSTDTDADVNAHARQSSKIMKKQHDFSLPPRPQQEITVVDVQVNQNQSLRCNLTLEKPDIILVENLDTIDTNAIILNNEANVNFEMNTDNRLSINAILRHFQLYTCCYNPQKRNQTTSLIVHPLSIKVNGASDENGNLLVDANVSRVNLSITAGTIALLSNISSTLTPKIQSASSVDELNAQNYSDTWNQKSVKNEAYWFLAAEEGEDALLAYGQVDKTLQLEARTRSNARLRSPPSLSQRVDLITIVIPVVRITLETGIGKKTIPLLAANSSFRATAKRTAKYITLDSCVSLEVGYYNTRLAMWEPIIEPIRQPCVDSFIVEKCVPWKLRFQCKMFTDVTDNYCGSDDNDHDHDHDHDDDDETDVSNATATCAKVAIPSVREKEALFSLHFSSDERIEVTFTKTCMDVVKTLSQSFNDVVREHVESATSYSNVSHDAGCGSSCYVLVNEFGVELQLSLTDDQPFKLIKNAERSDGDGDGDTDEKAVVTVPAGQTVRLLKKNATIECDENDSNVDQCLLDELNTITQRDTDLLRVTVVCRNKEVALPVCRADKRYFGVKSGHEQGHVETWGLISEVDVVEGSVIVTIRSVVRVYNHFNVDIMVYSMKNDKLHQIGKVNSAQSLSIPVEALYTSKGCLFFAPERYNVSDEPIVWKDLQKTVSFSKQICCISKNSENEDPFFMRILGEMEQVYYENTTCYTVASTAYSIRLRPTLIFKNLLPVPVVCCLQGIAVEYRLEAGQNINVCTAEPDHSTIVLRLDNYLDKVWSCKKLVKSDTPIFSVWTFKSYDSEKEFSLNLGVWHSNCEDSMIFALYSPYWMVNKTGLNLSYKGVEDDGMILHHPATFEPPILFSFKEKTFFSKKKACVRVSDGEWSDKFSMDVAGNSGSVFCFYSARIYQLGVYIRLNYNTLTKQVIFSPFFTVANNCPFAVELRESRIRNAAWIPVSSGACVPFWPLAKEDADKLLELRITNTVQVTSSFSYLKIRTHTLKLHNTYGGLQADVQVTEGGVYVAIAAFQPKMATALIINDTDTPFECCQTDLKANLRDRGSSGRANSCVRRDGEIMSLKAKHQVLFNWSAANMDNPVLTTNVSHIDLRTDGVGELRVLNDRDGGNRCEDGEKKFWISFLDGMQRVLLITADPCTVKEIQAIGDIEQTRQQILVDLKGIGFSLANNAAKQELLYASVSNSQVVWEVQKQAGKRFKAAGEALNRQLEEAYLNYCRADEASLNCDQEIATGKDTTITVNFADGYIIKPSVKKIRRSYNNGLWLQIRSSERYTQIHAKINRLQIDNQVYDCVFPVIFSPVPPPKSVANTHDENDNSAREKPFAELSIVQRIDEYAAVKQFKYFKILVQEFHVKVDIGFVNALVRFFEADRICDSEELSQFTTDQNVYKEPLGVHISSVTSQDFYDLVHFSPLKIHVSFSLCGENPNDGTPQQGLPIVNLLTQSVGVTLTDVNDVVFRLAYFERNHTFYSQSQLVSEVKTHYIGQFVKQLYVLVLGLDVLGNPFGLVTGLKQGVEDFFYEPFQGAIQGPSEFAEGVLLGVRSLFGHTVGGAAGAVGRITGAMGKGIAALTLDEEYQKKRRQRLAQQQTSLADGGRGLVMGVVEGVGGVISKPLSGAREEGVEGFVKGVGKGVVGLFMRPASGVVDFASGTVDVVRRVTTFVEDIHRYRLPRYFKENGLVVPYSQKDAQGFKLLLNTEKGKFMTTDDYIFHVPMADSNQPDKEVVLVTNNRIIYLVKSTDIFSDNIKIEWQYTWSEIKEDGIAENQYGVSIRVDSSDSRRPATSPVAAIGSLFKRASKGKILIVSDKNLRKWLVVKMRELARKANRSF